MAKRAVDNAFELEPGLPEAHLALAALYVSHGDYDRALREFAIAAARRPNDSDIFLARATLRTRQGNTPEALVDFETALRLDPASAIVASNYAHASARVRDFARAESLIDRAIALTPDAGPAYFAKAWFQLRRDGSTQRARAVLDEARTAGATEHPPLLYTQHWVDILDHRYEDAIDLLSASAPEAIASQFFYIPRAQLYAQAYGLMRRLDLERAYYDSARSFVSRKVQERPDDSRLRSALGIALAGLGRKQEAIQEAEGAVALARPDAWIGYARVLDLARIYVMVGEHDAALERLEHLLSIPGSLTPALLRIDPTWDPLRGHPRFKKLVGRR
jgi:serine/threonine-protein kinase